LKLLNAPLRHIRSVDVRQAVLVYNESDSLFCRAPYNAVTPLDCNAAKLICR